MATKKPVAKNVKSAPAKPVAKKVSKPVAPAKKVVAKPAPAKKAVAAKAPAKPAAKPAPAKKVAAKPAPKAAPAKKVAAKPAPKTAPVKKVAAKPAPKAAPAKKSPSPAKKPIAKPVAAPARKSATPAKKAEVKKPAAPVKKAEVKKPAASVKKAEVKPIAKAAPAPKEIKKPVPAKPTGKATKKSGPTKTIISSTTNPLIKKSDVFKTNTFGTPNLKNETGKVIAHRKTSELKRKSDDLSTVKKYEPEFTRSILDMTETNTGPMYRYSDEDLQEFREIILRKLDTAKAELQYLQGVIMRKDEGGTEDTENKYQNMEDGSASMEREQFTQLASRQITFINHLEQALVRIENKTYGICRETGKLIDKARLRAVPHATLSIEAKNAKKN